MSTERSHILKQTHVYVTFYWKLDTKGLICFYQPSSMIQWDEALHESAVLNEAAGPMRKH